MWATRNRIAHAYVHPDSAIIAATMDRDIPNLIETLRITLDASGG